MLNKVLFPHSVARDIQKQMILDVHNNIAKKKTLFVHAPTGLGKTAATLPIALSFALENNLTVFFLTSKHTQHSIAVETLRKVKKKHKRDFDCADILGKKWMCCHDISSFQSADFSEYCRQLREDNSCVYYTNLKSKDLPKLKMLEAQEVVELCRKHQVCPYEMAVQHAKKANVVVADYYYVFNPNIRRIFFSKTNKLLEESIIIVDEAHNLGERIRHLMTAKLSSYVLQRAIKEAKKFRMDNALNIAVSVQEVLNSLEKGEETRIVKNKFIEELSKYTDYEDAIAELEFAADEVREHQKQSSLGFISKFLCSWQGPDKGFARILSVKDGYSSLSYRCLDPAIVAGEVLNNCYSSILMSGTLSPTKMYKDLLGVPNADDKVYASPFSKKNRLNMIIPEVTTKFSERSKSQYQKIAQLCASIANTVKGNSLIFFPSYNLRDRVNEYFSNICEKTIFLEKAKLTQMQKADMLKRFSTYRSAVLLCAAGGSFGEGIDLPGIVSCVIVVGLPLNKPDLETASLIEYYDSKFGKGWDYGYVLPALTKTIQNAGRSIRTEKDKAVILFLDERYLWKNYSKCFPEDWDIEVGGDFINKIRNFFS